MHAITTVDTNRHIEKPFYFPGKIIPRDSYFCYKRFTCQTRKALQSWQSFNHTRSVTSTLQLVNRTSKLSMNDAVLSENSRHERSRIDFRQLRVVNRCYIILTITLFFFYNVLFFFTSPYDEVAPVFLQLTSIPARGGNVSQHNETARTETTSLISQESLDARIVHDFRFFATTVQTLAGNPGVDPLHRL